MHYYEGHWGGMHIIWWIIWLVLLVAIFFIPTVFPFQRTKDETPLQILKKRFAKGEITKAEYEDAKKTLEKDI